MSSQQLPPRGRGRIRPAETLGTWDHVLTSTGLQVEAMRHAAHAFARALRAVDVRVGYSFDEGNWSWWIWRPLPAEAAASALRARELEIAADLRNRAKSADSASAVFALLDAAAALDGKPPFPPAAAPSAGD